MITNIYYRNNYINVNVDKPPKDLRQLRAFLLANNTRDCFLKSQGGYYKLELDNKLYFISRVLYLLTLKDWLEIAKNDRTK
jgi:hypothetical protein